ncbi:hypothetical protein N7517_003632 [Penicillium concentricum]|uniref:Uncharacterized protein n=1 Tax=Penicillium concentricum TaxID=293559 RepID=A0A9W9S422_9EURO|nr:uncharacterized protein N7517_003632 [Penicillium concentricum]KAJ5371626.1 hypothetical protein N7517_003632 [Penicillium concentricum]
MRKTSKDAEAGEEDLAVVEPGRRVRDTKQIAGEAVVNVEESEKKDVKIVDYDLKKVKQEKKSATSQKSRAVRGRGKKPPVVEEK